MVSQSRGSEPIISQILGNFWNLGSYTENRKLRRIKKIEISHVSFPTFTLLYIKKPKNFKIQSSEIPNKYGIFDPKVVSLNGSLLMLPGYNVRLNFLCICTSINTKLTAIGKNPKLFGIKWLYT